MGVQIRVVPYRESSRILVEIRVGSWWIGGGSRALSPTPPDRVQIGVYPGSESPKILVEIRVEPAQIGVLGYPVK